MEQHTTDEQPTEVADSESTEIIEQIVITEGTEHVISNTSEHESTVYMIPPVGTTVEILHTDDTEEVSVGNTEEHDARHSNNDTVTTTSDMSTELQLVKGQKETFVSNDDMNVNSESRKDSTGQENLNSDRSDEHRASLHESNSLETDNSEVLCNSESVITTTVNDADPDYIVLDQDMLPDCVNQNCDTIDQSEFQLTEEPIKNDCNQRSVASNDNQKLDVQSPIDESTESVDLPGSSETVTPDEGDMNSITTTGTVHPASNIANSQDAKNDLCEIGMKYEVIEIKNDRKDSTIAEVDLASTEKCIKPKESVDIQSLQSKPVMSIDVLTESNEETNESEKPSGKSMDDNQCSEIRDNVTNDNACNEMMETTEELSSEDEGEIILTEISSFSKKKHEMKLVLELENNEEELCATENIDVSSMEVEGVSDPIHKERDADSEVRKLENNDIVKTKVSGTSEKRRSVIQDIVDDWMDENNEDIGECKQQPSKLQDSVEIELKSLLDDGKSDNNDSKAIPETCRALNVSGDEAAKKLKPETPRADPVALAGDKNSKDSIPVSKEHEHIASDTKKISGKESATIIQEIPNYIPRHVFGRSVNNPTMDFMTSKRKPQSPRPGVKIPGRHLTSQIASTAEVTEVLKERIKEKQKDLEVPQGGDILFVKKITQRLSSKLSGSSANPIPGLIPLPQNIRSVPESHENTTAELNKATSVDNTELLAILEGDVDPDWPNLNPPSITEINKIPESVIEHSTPPKLDPLIERELALKQLLELPTIPIKKNPAKKKKTFKPAPSKVISYETDKVGELDDKEKSIVSIDLVGEDAESREKNESVEKMDLTLDSPEKEIRLEKSNVVSPEVRLDESRSGRKRKPTEKAREHEQNTTKRQKVYKGKINVIKKPSQTGSSAMQSRKVNDHPLSVENQESQQSLPVAKQTTSKTVNVSEIKLNKNQNVYGARPKSQSLLKKGPQGITKRKMNVKKLLRQKTSTNGATKKSVNLKSKMTITPKKSGMKMKPKVKKRILGVSTIEMKPKKKSNEIDKLLQDEGVVNLLYDVEQPDKKRLIPITKSQTKVMDMQKVQRELKIRTKLVRNAVLRLRTSGAGTTKVSPRSKRMVGHSNAAQNDGKDSEQIKSSRSSISSPTEFIFPAKIRNAADASIIIRRHSSSSFSSASGSPRVSIDAPEKQNVETTKIDENAGHVTRSARRRHSQDGKTKQSTEVKKSKKKSVQKTEVENPVETFDTVPDEKAVMATRSNKRSEAKKVEKIGKHIEVIDVDESSNSSSISKIITRSNGIASGKVIPKNKKVTKSKVTFGKVTDIDGSENQPKQEDELSACLAAAATALSNVEGAPSRSGSTTTINRKQKVITNVARTSETDGGKKEKAEGANKFMNKEINVRRHGNLVQLILTPSSCTKIKNGITLQVMRELRETLSILRRDDECRVVLLTSTGGSFCEGLELSGLLYANKDERRIHAQEMANSVKDFIKSLASFNKPIVAGVQGAAVGLSVTMLPLFDLVIASDKATFSTPYGKLGQIPEGASILTLSHTLGSAVTSELLLGGRTLTANEALRAGLVTRVLWPDRFQEELLPSLLAMSEQSAQSMEATKALLRHSLRKKLDAALESESYLLVQHWCSAECQAAIKAYIDGEAH